MNRGLIWFIPLMVLILNGCGGDGGGSTSTFSESGSNPSFLSDNKISVPMNSINTFSFKVVAKDASNVKYYITGKDSKRFFIDVMTGELTFNDIVDIQPSSTYEFTVIAEDGVSHREMQSITVTIVGSIEDSNQTIKNENDHTAPVFSEPIKDLTVQEHQTDLFRTVATDESRVTYTIGDGDDANYFNINRDTGVVSFISQPPNYDTKNSYNFSIIATDDNGNRSHQEVHITVIKPMPISTRFTRDNILEVVIDNDNGLMWQDNYEVQFVSKQWLTNDIYDICKNNIDSSACNDTSGDTAMNYCSHLTLGEYDNWRLPNIDELISITDNHNRHINDAFQNIIPKNYWSSTTFESDLAGAWVVNFDDGNDNWGGKSDEAYVRCVRVNNS